MKPGFKPEAYEFVGALYLSSPVSEEYAEYVDSIFEDIFATFDRYDDVTLFNYDEAKKLAVPDGRFATKGTCDHCGAHFSYGAVFREKETSEHLIVGHICATNKLSLSDGGYADALLRKAAKTARTKAKMKAVRAANSKRLAEGELGNELTEALNYPHPFCESIRDAFLDGRELTARMKAAVLRAVEEDWAGTKLPPEPDPVAIPELPKRSTFSGEVLGLKDVESYYGITTKMVFRDDRGFKLFGTVPSALYDNGEPLKGCRVAFDAAVEVSDDDPTFGFFSRPTKASRLAA